MAKKKSAEKCPVDAMMEHISKDAVVKKVELKMSPEESKVFYRWFKFIGTKRITHG
ncbi:hypothetical protein HY493_00155 [Candidatus Woesearchaeota archaeon]|nr:hypothetical protein [Candidatus Woesearchaeota archaeon]